VVLEDGERRVEGQMAATEARKAQSATAMLELIGELEALSGLAPVAPVMAVFARRMQEEMKTIGVEWDGSDAGLYGSTVVDRFSFSSGTEVNGWVIPQSWEVVGVPHITDMETNESYFFSTPLAVAGYSGSFYGEVMGSELVKHLFTHPNTLDAEWTTKIPYHCDWYYRPWEVGNWGLCVTHKFRDDVVDDHRYMVNLQTNKEPGKMHVSVATLLSTGNSEESGMIILNAHNCHTSQANDDLSGVVVGLEVMRRLAEMPERRYNYQLVIAPEFYGPVMMLDQHAKGYAYAIGGIFLECLGSSGKLVLQESYSKQVLINQAASHVIKREGGSIQPFRTVVGNDEVIWEAPPHNIPTVSLSRWPFDEYHSNLDTASRLSQQQLEEAVDTVVQTLTVVELNQYPTYTPVGHTALSNPKYDLYIQALGDPTRTYATDVDAEVQWKWNMLMVRLPMDMEQGYSVLDIAERHGLPFREVYDYIERWVEKGVAEWA
jgi:aminopeptidase-like protein